MFPMGLFITTLFTISNFIYVENGFFERMARSNYIEYLTTNNEVQYESNFVDNLYNYGYYDSVTSVTVLTHGMFGNKDYWFPKIYNQSDGKYYPNYFDSNSLAFKLINTQNFIMNDIPILSFKPHLDSFGVIDYVEIQQLKYEANNSFYFDTFDIDYSDKNYLLNKHVVLIYDGEEEIEFSNASNEKVASYFCDSLDSVLAKLVLFHQGKLPRINLIGHSRGGILNLYYARKRKAIIDNYIAIGTPFCGSLLANLATSLYNLEDYFGNGNELLSYYASLICDETMLNTHEQFLYSLTNPYKVAIGAQMTPGLFCSEILDLINFAINSSDIDLNLGPDNIVTKIVRKIIDILSDNDNLLMSTIDLICSGVKSICNEAIDLINLADRINDFLSLIPFININSNFESVKVLISSFLNDVIKFCDSFLSIDEDEMCIKNDFCVELDSQLGNLFSLNYFDQTITISFGKPNYSGLIDEYLSDTDLPKLIHNYESNFPPIVNSIYTILFNRNSINHITIPNSHYEMDINPYQVPFYNLTPYYINEFYSSDLSFFGNEFGFRDYYYYDSEVSAHPGLMDGLILELNNIEIETQRMRTGFIQNERIVMSPNRTNAGLAFIEFYFSEPIHGLVLDISLWSEHELYETSEDRFAYTFSTEMRDFILGVSDLYWNQYHNALYGTMTARGKTALMSSDLVFDETFGFVRQSVHDLPTDRNDPDKLYIGSINGFDFIGFYCASNVTSTQRNKGRICLSNFEIYR